MAILDRFVLPPDVSIVPVADLPAEVRERIGHSRGDYAVTRPGSRTMSSLIDDDTVALLERFRSPVTLVDAVIGFSGARGRDPRETLDEAFGVLAEFVNEGLLVAADSPLARPIATSHVPGDRFSEFDLVAPAHVLVDSEVHLARADDGSPVALKIARAGFEEPMSAAFSHEAEVLRQLDGRVTPRLLRVDEHDGRPFLATAWFGGVDVFQAAAELRSMDGSEGRARLLELAERVIGAYDHLHAQGVLHGDVHPRNVLVDATGSVAIIDFGLAARMDGTRRFPRGGIDLFMEPELARANLAGTPQPAATAAGEQYSLGSMIYLLLTGAHTHAFSLEREQMLRQVVEEPPLRFVRQGVAGLGAVEGVLALALAKEPGERYGSTAGFRRAFEAAAERDRRTAPADASAEPRSRSDAAREVLDDVLARLAVPSELFADGLPAPTASAMNGGAGFAYSLLRVASVRGDAYLLSLADLWSTRSVLASASDAGFWSAELDIVPEIFGENSFYHHAAGVHCVEALVARACGDEHAEQLALDAFTGAALAPCDHLDVAFGRAGLLLGCSLALEGASPAIADAPLRAAGAGLCDSVSAELARQPPIRECVELDSLGAAHGWAGYLFALLRWSEASGVAPPAGLDERLDELAALGWPAGRGIDWPFLSGGPPPDLLLGASWCNGAAGFVHLWIAANALLGDERFARLAELAAWRAYEGPSIAPGDLCCGLAGRAYALLALYARGGEAVWLVRARVLADRAAEAIRRESLRRDSLYKGEVGVALLAADLEDPERACMPLFAAEGWPRGDRQSA